MTSDTSAPLEPARTQARHPAFTRPVTGFFVNVNGFTFT